MVRNWQARVEAADTRRKEAKSRKQKSEDKRQYKQWVQDFQDGLDRHRETLSHVRSTDAASNEAKKQWKLSIWTDVPPSHVLHEDWDEREDPDVRKKRSKSFGDGVVEDESESPNPRGKNKSRRGRSYSVTEAHATVGKKKIHPRSSKEPPPEPDETSGTASQQFMCRSYFFTGLCDRNNGRKNNAHGNNGGGCRYVHGSQEDSSWSLHHVLSVQQAPKTKLLPTASSVPSLNHVRSAAESEAQLKAAELAELDAANAEASSLDRVGAMEMVYHLETTLETTLDTDVTDTDDPTVLRLWSDQMSQALSKCNLYLASVVYVAMDGVLIFDRYQNGTLFASDRDFLAAVMGADAVTSRRERNDARAAETIQTLPGPVVAHILAYLPDGAVATAARVCQAWHTEVTLHLPNVWRHLLDRHDWPHPPERTSEASGDEPVWSLPNYAQQFQQHYTVIRDLKALQKGLHAICDIRSGNGAVVESEMAFQEFASRKHASSQPNCCVALQEWAPNQLLVAYQLDCSLRLFQTVAKMGKSNEKVCRELVCQRIDPYRHTKKRNCRIVALGLDEQCVASLCHVTGNNTDAEAYILVVMSRDDFLLGDSSGAAESSAADDILETLRVIDIGESVLNYLVATATDDGDSKWLDLMDFLSHGGDVGDVEILASQTLATCG